MLYYNIYTLKYKFSFRISTIFAVIESLPDPGIELLKHRFRNPFDGCSPDWPQPCFVRKSGLFCLQAFNIFFCGSHSAFSRQSVKTARFIKIFFYADPIFIAVCKIVLGDNGTLIR